MRILVTGASGFVGRRLQPRLIAAGHEVFGIDRETDVTDRAALAAALARTRPEAVVHLAALSSVADSMTRPLDAYRTNFLGTRALLSAVAAAAPHARVLLAGTADVYAATVPRQAPFDETTPLRPRSPYARSKAAAELLGRLAAEQGLDVVCVRAFNHTGPGQSDRFVVASFARQVAAIARGRAAARLAVGNLASVRDFLHVDDVIEAYRRLLDPGVPPGVYNVASGLGVPIRQVLDGLLALAGLEVRVEVDPERFRPTDWLVGDATRLARATGWAPRIGLAAILRASYEDWLERDAAENP